MFLVYLLVPVVISAVLAALALAGVIAGVLLRRFGRRRLALFCLFVPCCASAVGLLFGWIRIFDTGDILGFFVGPPTGAIGGLVLALALRSQVEPDSGDPCC